jgi:hypothetical protein
MADRLEALRSPWRVYFVVLATLGVKCSVADQS